jgi:hypothetical protein
MAASTCPEFNDQPKIEGMLFFHAFTGCDVVSAFRGNAKKSALQTWGVCPEASDVFTTLCQYPPTVGASDMKVLEQFVIKLYDRSSPTTKLTLMTHARTCLLERSDHMKPFRPHDQPFFNTPSEPPTK